MDQKAVPRAQLIFAMLRAENTRAGLDEMEQIVIVDFGTGLMKRKGLALAGKQYMQMLLIVIHRV
ncbi:hypothetical protein D3C81_1998260 [compost metagenome]